MQLLRQDRKVEIDQVWQYKGISMAFAANINSRAVQTASGRKAHAFQVWKQAAKEIGMTGPPGTRSLQEKAKTRTSNPKTSARVESKTHPQAARPVDAPDNAFVEAASIAFCGSSQSLAG